MLLLYSAIPTPPPVVLVLEGAWMASPASEELVQQTHRAGPHPQHFPFSRPEAEPKLCTDVELLITPMFSAM